MTNAKNFDTIEPTNPVLTVAPSKEETEMLGATEKSLLSIADCPRRTSGWANPCPSKIKM